MQLNDMSICDSKMDYRSKEAKLLAKEQNSGALATTMSVPTMAKLLGIKKTDSYWLVKKHFFTTVLIAGRMRVDINSFEEWYSRQVKYKKIGGPPPGNKLIEESYSAADIGQMLNISTGHAYDIMKEDKVPFILVDYWKRWTKEEFEKWYHNQDRYRTQEDSGEDRDSSMSIPEMAFLLGISREKGYQLLKSSGLKFFMVGARKRVRKHDFLRWYVSQTEYKMVYPNIEEAQYAKKQSVSSNIREAGAAAVRKKQAKVTKRTGINSTNSECYSLNEVSAIMKKSPRTIAEKIAAGKIPGQRVGRSYIVPKAEFILWAQEQEEEKRRKKDGYHRRKK